MRKQLHFASQWLAFFLFEGLKVEGVPGTRGLAGCMLMFRRPSQPTLALEQPGGGSLQCFWDPLKKFKTLRQP